MVVAPSINQAMQTQVVNVTPETARAWLAFNTFNRRVSEVTVARYARDMAAGDWLLNHQGIAFDDTGTLVDGQHRLLAIIRSGVTVPMLVTWGASRVGIDELRVRNPAEVVKFGNLSDWVDGKALQTAKQMLVLFSGGDVNKTRSTAELVEFCDKHKTAITFTLGAFRNNKKGISTAACKATIATAFYHIPTSVLERFVDRLYSGVITNANEVAAIRAREAVLDNGFSGGSSDRRRMAKRMARAIVAFAEGEEIKRLMEPKEFPFLLPEANEARP